MTCQQVIDQVYRNWCTCTTSCRLSPSRSYWSCRHCPRLESSFADCGRLPDALMTLRLLQSHPLPTTPPWRSPSKTRATRRAFSAERQQMSPTFQRSRCCRSHSVFKGPVPSGSRTAGWYYYYYNSTRNVQRNATSMSSSHPGNMSTTLTLSHTPMSADLPGIRIVGSGPDEVVRHGFA